MLKAARFFVNASLMSLPLALFAGTPPPNVKDKMLADLDIIKSTFEVKYAPASWKKIYADWELETVIDQAKANVLESKDVSIKDFQRIVQRFFCSPQDYHVGVSFYSTEVALLPLRVHSTNGKYYIAWAYEPLFLGLEPIKIGDEVVYFNGKPIDDVVQELKKSDFSSSLSLTNQAMAETALTMRIGSSGHIVPKGPAAITVRHAGSKKLVTYRLNWLYLPEEIPNSLSPLLAAKACKLLQTDGARYYLSKSAFKKSMCEHPFFYKNMTTPLYSTYKTAEFRRKQILENEKENISLDEGTDDEFIGARKSFVPLLGVKTWESLQSCPFHAYIYLDEKGRKIGYIRLPNYFGGSISAEAAAEIINLFSEETEALVVDQVNNPGGNMWYMYALASMFTDQPLLVPKHRMTITQEDVFFALVNKHELEQVTSDEEARLVIGSSIAGYPVDLDLAHSIATYFSFIIDEWREGRHFTNAAFLYGIDYIKPHPEAHYSKPILFLVNELDFSCADFMPAILQDNKRAVIVGRRTAGAGGYVLEHSYPNLFGVQGYSFTGSIAERLDLNPIENLGVTPDEYVDLTQKDLEKGYADYKSKIQKAVQRLFDD